MRVREFEKLARQVLAELVALGWRPMARQGAIPMSGVGSGCQAEETASAEPSTGSLAVWLQEGAASQVLL